MPELDPTRITRLTASVANIICGDNQQAKQNLWLQKVGDPRYEDDGFSQSWMAQFGLFVEPFALSWHASKFNCELVDRGRQYFHPSRDYVSATLDSRMIRRGGVACNVALDCKLANAFRDIDEIANYYAPQMVVQTECADADEAALLIVRGGSEPFEVPIHLTDDYRGEVWRQIDAFWECIVRLEPPFELDFPHIVPPERWRKIDLDDDLAPPNWAHEMRSLLNTWLLTVDDAKLNEAAKTEIKKLFPDDCGKLLCGDTMVSRSRDNRVSIRRRKEAA